MKIIFHLKTLYRTYGILLIPTIILMALKLGVFYNLMGVSTNILPIYGISAFIIFSLFYMFKNKWIPASIYLAVSFIMFSDVAYSSFFNRYLSVNMLAATGLLGDVTASIKEIIRPEFFLLFLDCVFLFLTLLYSRVKQKKPSVRPFGDVNLTPKGQDAPLHPIVSTETLINRIREISENKVFATKLLPAPEGVWSTPKIYLLPAQESIGHKKTKKEGHMIRYAMGYGIRKCVSLFVVFVMVAVLLINPKGSYGIISINNQELFTYHTKDLIQTLTGKDFSAAAGSVDKKLFTGTYENQINGDLFGVAKDRNLIVIQLESFQNFVINAEYNGQELTPNLNRLLKEDTIYFDNYYQQVAAGNTSDAEYATNNGLYGTPSSFTYGLYEQNTFRGLPQLLKDEYGYGTAVFHAYEKDFWNRENVYPQIGFDHFYGKGDYDETETIGMGLSDKEWYRQAVDYMKDMAQPFYSFMITLSNHHPYYVPEKYQKIKLAYGDSKTLFGKYMQSVHYSDYAIGCFINYLKKAGLYDNSIIAFYGDHHGLIVSDDENKQRMSSYLGYEYDYDQMMNVPLIIHIPGENVTRTCSTVGGQTDFLPTIAYLLGMEKLDTLYIGDNLLTTSSGFVAEQYYVPKGSFFMDDIVFIMSSDGVFENSRAYNKKTKKEVPLEMCRAGYIRSLNQVYNTENYLKSNTLSDWDTVCNQAEEKIVKGHQSLIVKAGASDSELAGTNTLEALQASYDAGYRLIEIDLSWTSDGRTILLRDWDYFGKMFGTGSKQVSYDEYMCSWRPDDLTRMDFAMLGDWLLAHPSASVVIHLDENMDYLLDTILKEFPKIQTQIVPVFHNPEEYTASNYLREYPSILQIQENKNYNVRQLKRFIESANGLWAVALPASDALKSYKSLIEEDIFTYVYEVNDEETRYYLQKNGVNGIFTSVLR